MIRPDDEVMPYSDDETDDELDASTEDEEEEEPPGAPQPPGEPQVSGETQSLANVALPWFCGGTVMHILFGITSLQRWRGK